MASGGVQDLGDRAKHALEMGPLGGELLAAGSGEAVVAGPPVARRGPPFGGDPAFQQQPLQGMWGSTGQYRGSTNRGQIYSPDGRYIGQVQRPSTAPSGGGEGGFGRTTTNAARQADRQADINRPVYGANGQYLGSVNRQGQFYDSQGAYRGQMR